MTTKFIGTLLGSKNNQRKLLGLARYAGQNGVRAIQRSRRARGKPRLFPKVAPFRLMNQSEVAVPVRTNTASVTVSKAKRVSRVERAAIPVPANATAAGVTEYQFVQPTNVLMWPLLSTECLTYQRYSIKALRIIYEPVAGSAINGQLVVGLQPIVQAMTDTSSLISGGAPAIGQMPWQQTVNVGKSSTIDVPINQSTLSQGGQNLYLAFNGDGAGSATLDQFHQAGVLCYTSYNCSTQTGTLPPELGVFRFFYVVELSGQRLDTTSSSSDLFTASSSNDLLVRRAGAGYVGRPGTDEIYLHSFKHYGFLVKSPHGSTISLMVDGVDWSPSATVIDDGATNQFMYIPSRALPGRHVLTVDTNGAFAEIEGIQGLYTAYTP